MASRNRSPAARKTSPANCASSGASTGRDEPEEPTLLQDHEALLGQAAGVEEPGGGGERPGGRRGADSRERGGGRLHLLHIAGGSFAEDGLTGGPGLVDVPVPGPLRAVAVRVLQHVLGQLVAVDREASRGCADRIGLDGDVDVQALTGRGAGEVVPRRGRWRLVPDEVALRLRRPLPVRVGGEIRGLQPGSGRVGVHLRG